MKQIQHDPINVYRNRDDVVLVFPAFRGEEPMYGCLDAPDIIPAGSTRDFGYRVSGPRLVGRSQGE